ncbi:MAG TPA: AbrB/MazE/SpoVT family DNA-binding domain-containing protein [Candidatus Paceibacterota bacterium]|nr:AbrB/MazE/SpoVT family DNA-binding domain-containing protein [Candidatus Paceibacterota bacterium]
MKTRRKQGEENIRKITKMAGGSSYGITLPIEVIRRWGWKEHQKVQLEIDDENNQIIIKDWES